MRLNGLAYERMGWTLPGGTPESEGWRLGRPAAVRQPARANLIHRLHWTLPGQVLDFGGSTILKMPQNQGL